MKNSQIIPLDEIIALSAADMSMQYGLAITDAIIAAAAKHHDTKLITSDPDLKHLPNVTFVAK
jgi:predicted nucleic acid-binding protein